MNTRETKKTPFFTLRREGLVCLFLVMVTLVVYWQVGNHAFVNYDDNEYVTQNPHVQAGLTPDSIAWAFTATHASNWHPLTWLSHMADCQIYGLNPRGHHLTNLLFHILNSILLFLIFRRMTGSLWKSAFVAALFTIHPLHVESVAWVAERKDVLSTFFWMLTMGSYVWYVERSGTGRYLLVLLFFVLGLMVKPMLVTLPFVLLLLDYWPLDRFQFRHTDSSVSNSIKKPGNHHLVWEKTPLFALAAISSIVTFIAQQSGGAVRSLEVFPLNFRAENALVSYVGYIIKMILPHNLAVLYPHPIDFPMWQVAGAGLLLILIFFQSIRMMRRFPYLIVGWLWYLGTLVPVIGLVQVGIQSMANRYTYIPLIGIFIIIAWGITDLVARWQYRRIFLAISAGCILSALTILTSLHLQHWQSSITLFEHTLNVTANNYMIHSNMGAALAELGKIDEAIAHYSEALQINPGYAKAHNNLANALDRQGRVDEAIVHYAEALQINPGYAKAHYNLGNVLARQGRVDEAIVHYSKALLINPDYAKAHNNLGNVLARQERLDEAIVHYSEALRIRPDDTETRTNLKVVSAVLKETDLAIKRLLKSTETDPGNPELYYDLGNLYYRKRKLDEAIYQYQKSLSLQPDALQVLNNLAIVYITKKEYDKAVSILGRIAELQPDNAGIYYNIACMYSIQNKVEKSIDSLKTAIEKGYDNWDIIKTDRDLENIRSSPYYKELMSSR